MTKTLPTSARRRFSTLAIILMACTILWLAWTSQQRALLGWILARQTGQAVQIEHLGRFTLGSTIGVSARGIEITGDHRQISIAELALSLQTLPLLTRGELEFESLAARGLRIAVRSDDRESPAGISLSDLPYFSSLSLTDASIRYQSDDQDIQLTIQSLVGNPLPGGDLQFSLDGTLNGHSLTLLARLPATLSTASPDPVSIDLNWGQITGNLTGLIGHPATGRGSDLRISVSAPRSRALLDALGIPEMRDGPLQINARLLDLGSTLNLESQAAIGDFRIALSGTAADISMNRAEARFSVSGPSLFEAGATLDYPGFESLPFSATGNISRSGTHLALKQVTLKLAEGNMSLQADLPEYPGLTGMTLELSGQDFSSTILQPVMGRCELPDTPFNWQASLQRRGTKNHDLTATLSSSGHRLQIEGSLSWPAKVAHPDLRISSEGFTLSQLGSCFGIADLPDQATTFSAHVVGDEQALTLSGIDGTSGNLTLDSDIKLKRKPGDSEQALEVELRLQSSNLQETVKAFTTAPVTFYDAAASVSFSVAGTTGNLELRQAEFNVGDAKGSVSGRVGQLTTLAGLDLSFSFKGGDLNRVVVDPERPDAAPVPFSITGSVKSNGEDWKVEGVEVGIAQTRLTVSGNVPRNRQLSGLRLELAATGKDLENSLGPWLSQPVPNLPFEMSSKLQFDNDNVSVVLDADVGGHSLKADLLVDNPPDYSRSRGTLVFKGPSTRDMLQLLDPGRPILDREYSLALSLDGTTDAIQVNDLDVRVGESDLAGSLAIEKSPAGNWKTTGDLHSGDLFLPLFFPSLADQAPDTAKPARYFSPTPLPSSWIENLHLGLDYQVDRMTVQGNQSTSMTLGFDLSDGQLETRQLLWDGQTSKGNAKIKLASVAGQLEMSAEVYSSRLPLLWLLAGEPIPSDNTHYASRLTSRGNSIASLMANLDGNLLFLGGAGRISTKRLDRLFGDFLDALSNSILGGEKESEANVSCSAGAARIKGGIANLDPGLVIRTDKVDIFAGGTIDLAQEKPDLAVYSRSRTGLGISAAKILAPSLKVGGTLVDPKISVATTGNAISAYFAVFSGGLSLLANGLLDRVITGTRNPCAALFDEAKQLPGYSGLAE